MPQRQPPTIINNHERERPSPTTLIGPSFNITRTPIINDNDRTIVHHFFFKFCFSSPPHFFLFEWGASFATGVRLLRERPHTIINDNSNYKHERQCLHRHKPPSCSPPYISLSDKRLFSLGTQPPDLSPRRSATSHNNVKNNLRPQPSDVWQVALCVFNSIPRLFINFDGAGTDSPMPNKESAFM